MSAALGDPRLGDEAQRQQHRGDADRHVDEEDPLPRQVLGEDAAEQQADGRAADGDRAQTPSALVRSAPSLKVVVTIDSAAGDTIAAPRPCSARATMSNSQDSRSPPGATRR